MPETPGTTGPCTDRCQGSAMHSFYRSGGGFRWMWPKFDRLNSTDKRARVGLNRYPHNVIGAYVVLHGRGYGLRWKGSR